MNDDGLQITVSQRLSVISEKITDDRRFYVECCNIVILKWAETLIYVE